jgi:nucleotide-binding universal stress UspA family protein
MKVIAAVNDCETGAAVLSVAKTLASRLGADVESVHIAELPDGEVAAALSKDAGVSMRTIVSPDAPSWVLVSLLSDRQVALMVLGARDETGARRAAGHVALGVATSTGKPVVLVPPMDCGDLPPLARVLIPLDGTPQTSEAVRGVMRMFGGSDVDVVGLHVFQKDTVPRFWDKPEHEEAIWGDEFAARHAVAPGTRLELRLGSPAEAVVDLTNEERPGMIALAWSQHVAEGRATVVSEVLRRCRVPVLLIPAAEQGHRSLPFGSLGPVGDEAVLSR